MRFLRTSCEFVITLLLLGMSDSVRAAPPVPPEKNEDQQERLSLLNSSDNDKAPSTNNKKPVISLAESIEITRKSLRVPEVEKVRRQYWKDTFDDIKKLANGRSDLSDANYRRASFLNQWKAWSSPGTTAGGVYGGALSDTAAASNATTPTLSQNSSATRQQLQPSKRPRPQRFDGFPSWERMLADWQEEIQEYMDQASEDSEGGYLLSNYGRAPTREKTEKPTVLDDEKEHVSVVSPTPPPKLPAITKTTTTAKEKRKLPMPIPAPAKPGEAVLPHTDIADKSKRLLIVTTASMPWRTGTAVNPLLRAAYLTKDRKEAGGSVTLMLPWLERQEDQLRVYGADNAFASPEEQAEYIRTWLRESAGMPQASQDLIIQWYTAWQNPVENSLYSMGDITALISADDVDICILEEPEHLNWYRAPGEHWTQKFKHVVGILHTNYFSYALDQPAAIIRAPAMRLLCSWMCRAHCHRVIKLSGTIDKVAPEKELVENVHGVRGTFLDVGEKLRAKLESPLPVSVPVFGADAEPTIYFLGKMLWSKGIGSLMELLKYAEESANLNVAVDMYGGGPDMDAAVKKAEKLGLQMPFHGPLDHAELADTHKIFVNPSTSEVLCTASAEALAMGKFVILPSHPSNDFFAQFPNCLTYATKEEFVGYLYYAMTHAPAPLTEEYAFALSWEAATQRLEAAGCIPKEESERMKEFLASDDAGIEITLPSIVESEEGRKGLSTVLQFSRQRYRQFRSKLSQEIQENKVLPPKMKERLAAELDKRLDLDLDELLTSPKLRLKLSPAELDKALLEFYDRATEGAGGDLLRVIGGGGEVGLQNLYMRRHAERERWRKLKDGIAPEIFPTFNYDDGADEKEGTASVLVRRLLRRNISKIGSRNTIHLQAKKVYSKGKENDNTPSMCYAGGVVRSAGLSTWSGLRSPQSLHRRIPTRSATNKFSLLI